MKNALIILILATVLPVMGKNENSRPAHWGAGGQMPARKAASQHWGAGGKIPAKTSRQDAHQRMLDKYDTNKDGKLDETERKAMKK